MAINEIAKFKFQWNLFYFRVYLQDLHHLLMDEMIKVVSQAESSQTLGANQLKPVLFSCLVYDCFDVFVIHIAVLCTNLREWDFLWKMLIFLSIGIRIQQDTTLQIQSGVRVKPAGPSRHYNHLAYFAKLFKQYYKNPAWSLRLLMISAVSIWYQSNRLNFWL